MNMMSTSMMINMVMLIIIIMMLNKSKMMKQKKMEFECGFNSISNNRLPFSSQFFLVTILFLIFDLEISLVMPISLEENKSINNMMTMMKLMIMLTVGLMVEWLQGMVEWTK